MKQMSQFLKKLWVSCLDKDSYMLEREFNLHSKASALDPVAYSKLWMGL